MLVFYNQKSIIYLFILFSFKKEMCVKEIFILNFGNNFSNDYIFYFK